MHAIINTIFKIACYKVDCLMVKKGVDCILKADINTIVEAGLNIGKVL